MRRLQLLSPSYHSLALLPFNYCLAADNLLIFYSVAQLTHSHFVLTCYFILFFYTSRIHCLAEPILWLQMLQVPVFKEKPQKCTNVCNLQNNLAILVSQGKWLHETKIAMIVHGKSTHHVYIRMFNLCMKRCGITKGACYRCVGPCEAKLMYIFRTVCDSETIWKILTE